MADVEKSLGVAHGQRDPFSFQRLKSRLLSFYTTWTTGVSAEGAQAPYVMAIGAVVLYILYFSFYASWRLMTFQLGTDWGVIANATYYTSQGYFFQSVIRGMENYTFWQQHISPILFLYVPIFRINGLLGSLSMVISQAVAIGLAGYVLFLLARHWLKNDWAALLATLFFFANGRIQLAILHDYHMLTLTPLLLFTAFWGAATGRRAWMWAGFVGTLLLREDTFLALLGLPLYLLVAHRKWRVATAMVVVIIGYELLLFKILFPFFGKGYPYFAHYKWLAPSPGLLLMRIITEPYQVLHAIVTERNNGPLVSFLNQYFWLPLFSPSGWVTGMFAMSESLLSNKGSLMKYVYHYVVPPAAALTLGTLLTIQFWMVRLKRWISPAPAVIGVLTLLIGYNLVQAVSPGAMPYSKFIRLPQVAVSLDKWNKAVAVGKLMERIPDGTPIQVSYNLFTRYHTRPGVTIYMGKEYIQPEIRYLLLDRGIKTTKPYYRVNYQDIPNLIRSREWVLVGAWQYIDLLERGDAPAPKDSVVLAKISPSGVQSAVGQLLQGGKVLTSPKGRAGHLVYGPYIDMPAGEYRASFLLETDAREGVVARIDFTSDTGQRVWAEHTVTAEELRGGPTRLEIRAKIPQAVRNVEARVYSTGLGTLTYHGSRIDWIVTQ